MKYRITSRLVALAVSLTVVFGVSAEKIRVACMGNSITYGAGIANRESNSYPAQLAWLLGDGYDVKNFGRNSATMLFKGNLPYVKTEEFSNALAFNPDIVFLGLGTNDTKPQNMRHFADFSHDASLIIDSLRSLPSHPRVILLSPMRCFLPAGSEISDSINQHVIAPALRALASEKHVELIDLSGFPGSTLDESLMPDRLHPSSIGAGLLARRLYDYLRPEGYDPNPATRPVPGNEYRSGAGWREGADWHAVAREISDSLAASSVDLLFIGNSITQGFQGTRQLVTWGPGRQAVYDMFPGVRWQSAGISGDRTQNVLWRIINGGYGKSRPKVVVITIGVNNVIAGDTPERIAAGEIAVAEAAAKEFPGASIFLLGPLPCGHEPSDPRRLATDMIHSLVSKAQLPTGVKYINPTSWFVDEDSRFIPELYGGDGIHLTPDGYKAWLRGLAPYISPALK